LIGIVNFVLRRWLFWAYLCWRWFHWHFTYRGGPLCSRSFSRLPMYL